MIGQKYTQSNSEIPAAIYQQAQANGLSLYVGVYKPMFTNVFAIIGLVIGANILYSILLTIIKNVAHTIITNWYIISFFIILGGLGLLLDCSLRVYLFSNGLVRVKGSRVDFIRWDQITAFTHLTIRKNISLGWKKNGFVIRCSNGASFRFFPIHLRHVEHLNENVRRGILQQRMPEVIASYNSGSMMPFGPLTVSRHGLSDSHELLCWNEVQSVTIMQNRQGEDWVVIKQVGEELAWAVFKSSLIPRLLIFMELVNYARTEQPS